MQSDGGGHQAGDASDTQEVKLVGGWAFRCRDRRHDARALSSTQGVPPRIHAGLDGAAKNAGILGRVGL